MVLTNEAQEEIEGCKRFLCMILVQAIVDLDYTASSADYSKHQLAGHTVFIREQTRQWFTSEEDDCLTSYVSICKVLEIDPEYLRDKYSRKIYCINEVVNGQATRVYDKSKDTNNNYHIPRYYVGGKLQQQF